MNDTIHTLKELEDLFFEWTCYMMGLDSTKEENQSKVRIAWPISGAPTWSIDEDVCFIRVTPIDDNYARTLDRVTLEIPNSENMKKETGYTRVIKIDWCFYGPNSFDIADKVRFKIFDHDLNEKYRKEHLGLVTDVSMPQRVPELYNNQWWDRTDFTARFNELVVRRSEIPTFDLSEGFTLITDR